MRLFYLTGFLVTTLIFNTSNLWGQSLNLLEALYSKETREIPVSDSVSLKADVYMPIPSRDVKVPVNLGQLDIDSLTIFPAGQQYLVYDTVNGQPAKNPRELPFLLQRTPYNRSGQENLGALTFLGYGVAIQNNRGRFDSEGVYYPFVSNAWETNNYHPGFNHTLDKRSVSDPRNSNNHADGGATVNYLVHGLKRLVDTNQDGNADLTVNLSNGSIGMIGASAAGNSQFQAAASTPAKPADSPGLKSLLPIVATGEYHQSTAFHNGVYRRSLVESWIRTTFLNGLITDTTLVAADQSLYNATNTIRDYPQRKPAKAADQAVGYLTEQSFSSGKPAYYPNTPMRPEMDISRAMLDQQGNADPEGRVSRYQWLDMPTYHLTGWWDIFINGQINTWQNMAKYTDLDKNFLVIGPWTHQRIGQQQVGDVRFPDNVDRFTGDIDLEGSGFSETLQGELLPWLRSTLNRNAYKDVGTPTFVIRATPGFKKAGQLEYRAPSKDYKVSFSDMLAFLNGKKGLSGFPIAIKGPFGNVTNQQIQVPAVQVPGFDGLGDLAVKGEPFAETPSVRMYMAGPEGSQSTGNYWLGADTFPPQRNDRQVMNIYWQGGQKLGINKPDSSVSGAYQHDPTQPVATIGGNNLVLNKNGELNQGPKNLAAFEQSTMPPDHSLQWETKAIEDSLAILGTPKMHLEASSSYADSTFQETLTNTHFFVRVLDVYPDGREVLVSEGAINTHARALAEKLAKKPGLDHKLPFTIDTTPFSNVETGKRYRLTFNLLPVGYTFGPDHRLKIVITSSNHPKYQVSPSLPLNTDSFFRWSPLRPGSLEHPSGFSKPKVLEQTVYNGPSGNTRIAVPVLGKTLAERPQNQTGLKGRKQASLKVYPNPVQQKLYGKLPTDNDYHLQIHSMTGQAMKHTMVSGSFEVSMKGFSPGMYFLKLSQNGEMVTTQKIIKE